MKSAKHENSLDRRAAAIAGFFFLLAMITSLTGGSLIEYVIKAPDYLITASQQVTTLMAGVFLELINAISVVGIAAAMFQFVKRYSPRIAAGYLSFRIIESAVCTAAAVIPISYLALSREYLPTTAPDTGLFQLAGVLLSDVRANITGLLIPIFFCLGALLFYYVMYRTKLVPRFISVWGLISVLLVIFLNLYPLNESIKMYFALPIILNEIFLGVWLISKGVNTGDSAAFRSDEGELL